MGESLSGAGPTGRNLVAVWFVTAVLLGGLLVWADATQSSLDDPDPAQQRPGFLDANGLPRDISRWAEIVVPGHRAVVFFERPDRLATLCRALRSAHFGTDVRLVVVVDEAARCADARLASDAPRATARAIGMRQPRDGGAPVGYAVVDSDGRVRYRTLDPGMAERLDEVRTILDAVP